MKRFSHGRLTWQIRNATVQLNLLKSEMLADSSKIISLFGVLKRMFPAELAGFLFFTQFTGESSKKPQICSYLSEEKEDPQVQ